MTPQTRAHERFSVIMPCYNAASFIREAVESALAQTHPLHELIVVDDGSTDASLDILEGITDSRLRVIRAAHGGVSRARNRGLEEATGDYVCFLDADDRWFPTTLEREAAVFRKEPDVGVIILNFERFDEAGVFPATQFAFYPEVSRLQSRPARGGAGRVIVGDPFSELVAFDQLPGWTPATVFRASAIAGLSFDETLPPCEDLDFCLRAFLRTSVAYIDQPLVQVRRHGANMTADTSGIPALIGKVLTGFDSVPMTPIQRRALNARLAKQHIALGVAAAGRGEPGETCHQFWLAFRRGGRLLSLGKQMLLVPLRLLRSAARSRRARIAAP